MMRSTAWILTTAGAFGLAACSLAPKYQVPDVKPPPSYKESLGTEAQGTWQPALPAEDAERGAWWKVFGEPQLDDLEEQAMAANPSLAAAAARVQEARGAERVTGAARFPDLSAGFGPTRQQNAPQSLGVPDTGVRPDAQTVWRAQANISYEVDLFGRVASSVAAARADSQEAQALFRSVQLMLQADVAQTYFRLRELDAELVVYDRAIVLRQETLNFVATRFEAGEVTDLDKAQAEAELASARSDAMSARRSRAATEHALAVLLGKAPADFAFAPAPLATVQLNIPAGLPSTLLERRPDIAAAERAMAATNARVGVAKAAYFPSLVLTGTGGYEAKSLGDVFKWSSRTFLLGPLVGTVATLPLFDGGIRKGNLEQARARYEESVAQYRGQVLVGFREVEDSLSALRILRDQTAVQGEAVSASTRAFGLSKAQYEDGSVAYLNILDAERVVLAARLNEVRLRGEQAGATVDLIRALGGGWAHGAVPDTTTPLAMDNANLPPR
ncbi:efflux transporter outer membrane subunit [Luteibacter aegosomaticola]|uniref:efflux transporter outer membrane subunit n=1 Tax=Luteibacter aegosomaticola TaxID=2911538 RepID=UPI001FF7694F|nr:efflux transporter outer membrane subunit [Luteibacter aegosomaticola]UPG90231.1 efflux transporter outer membrane subunit [Luteibacter aegosomaticola]